LLGSEPAECSGLIVRGVVNPEIQGGLWFEFLS